MIHFVEEPQQLQRRFRLHQKIHKIQKYCIEELILYLHLYVFSTIIQINQIKSTSYVVCITRENRINFFIIASGEVLNFGWYGWPELNPSTYVIVITNTIINLFKSYSKIYEDLRWAIRTDYHCFRIMCDWSMSISTSWKGSVLGLLIVIVLSNLISSIVIADYIHFF